MLKIFGPLFKKSTAPFNRTYRTGKVWHLKFTSIIDVTAQGSGSSSLKSSFDHIISLICGCAPSSMIPVQQLLEERPGFFLLAEFPQGRLVYLLFI